MNENVNIKAITRLNAVSSFIKKASDSYHDKDEFIINVNVCIQELRNVTFILQGQKKEIESFSSWYEKCWRPTLKEDKILNWLCESRTKIVHYSDLEFYSYISISVHDTYLSPPIFSEIINPSISNHEI
ncbi:MAG: hypothetical protein JW982_01245, partial [Spirochaetes bacterium]|nr:hypothetical protein [Spirochaetota bacterium]